MKKFSQSGVALSEFVVVGPLVLFMGLVGVQYGLIYNAKMNVTYAAYEAARSGAMYNADAARIQDAFYKGLVPYFATTGIYLPGNIHIASPFSLGSANPSVPEVGAEGYALKELIQRSESAFIGIHMVNPSKASFDDWSDSELAHIYTLRTGYSLNGRRIIPNDNLDTKPNTTGPTSLQSIQDANVLKLRITYGYEPRVPMMGKVFSSVVSFFNGDRDAVSTRILAAGRIPITVDVSAQMLSPPIESGLPMTTVNRTGYLIGPNLVDAIVGGQAMQWQVGQTQNGVITALTDNVSQQTFNAAQQAIQNGDLSSLPSAIGGSLVDFAQNTVVGNSPTGWVSSGTNSIVGDTNNLISCASDTYSPNFF